MHNLILASKSKARQDMLRAAGLEFQVIPADIDEDTLTKDLLQQGAGAKIIAGNLAAQKALAISRENPDALVIGSDQILECEGKLYGKAANEQEAREKLQALQGKTHHLISAAALARGGEILWQAEDSAALTMRIMDEEFLGLYCTSAKDVLTSCVGAYALEASGVWLFSDIKGDYFTILGMPLLALLGALHDDYGFTP